MLDIQNFRRFWSIRKSNTGTKGDHGFMTGEVVPNLTNYQHRLSVSTESNLLKLFFKEAKKAILTVECFRWVFKESSIDSWWTIQQQWRDTCCLCWCTSDWFWERCQDQRPIQNELGWGSVYDLLVEHLGCYAVPETHLGYRRSRFVRNSIISKRLMNEKNIISCLSKEEYIIAKWKASNKVSWSERLFNL
jgi:hypothetical protein